jgi:hypothetical protein
MKLLFHFKLLIILAAMFFSCADRLDPIGKWSDVIKLSTKSVEFDAHADSVTITTEGDWWWVTDVSVDDTVYYDFRDVNLEADNFSIQRDCFVVERRDKTKLFIKVDENPANVQRLITVGLEAGDYFDKVTVNQKPN